MCVCVCMNVCVCVGGGGGGGVAKNSHWELCGARSGSSTVVVNLIGFAT